MNFHSSLFAFLRDTPGAWSVAAGYAVRRTQAFGLVALGFRCFDSSINLLLPVSSNFYKFFVAQWEKIVYIAGMNWKNIIAELQSLGVTQAEIAERIGKTQGWVSSVANEKIGDLRYSDGNELLVLLEELRSARGARIVSAVDAVTPAT